MEGNPCSVISSMSLEVCLWHCRCGRKTSPLPPLLNILVLLLEFLFPSLNSICILSEDPPTSISSSGVSIGQVVDVSICVLSIYDFPTAVYCDF